MLLVGAIVLIMIFTVAQLPVKQQEAEAANYPEGAVEWIFKNKPEGKMFNSYNWGGYLIWRLYPDYPVSIDGRADLYGEKMLTNYFDIYTAKSGWEEKLRQENIRYILVETDSRLKDAIEQSSNWKTAYKDSLSVIFTSR